jgi:hypothetical protein
MIGIRSRAILVLLAACGGASSVPTLEGSVRVAFVDQGAVLLTDGTNAIPMFSTANPSVGDVELSPLADTAAVCAEVDKGSIWPVGGAIAGLGTIDTTVSRCKNARPLAGADTYVWIQYGQGVSPANRIRFTDHKGRPVAGDSFGRGASDVWGPTFVEQGRAIVAIYGDSSDTGPLHHIDRDTGVDEILSTLPVRYPFAANDTFAVGGSAATLYRFDIPARTSRVLIEFPAFGAPGCAVGASSNPLCFLHPMSPSIDAVGEYVTFIARGDTPFTKDTDGDVFVFHVPANQLLRITDDESHRDTSPRLTPDGKWVYWVQDGSRILRSRTDGGTIETWFEHTMNPTISLAVR